MNISQPMMDTHEIIGILQKKYKCSSQTAEGIMYAIRKAYLNNMENLATKEQLDCLKESLEKQLENLATKEDLLELATKTQQEISKLATKEELSKLATKEELSKLATKEDLLGLATKEEISKLATKEELALQLRSLRWTIRILGPIIIVNTIALITIALYLASM